MAALLGLALMVTVAAQVDDVAVVAAEVGVDAEDLRGAMTTMQQGPREYLIGVGMIAAPPPSVASYAQPAPSVSGIWSALSQCEAGGNPRTNTGNGYFGMFQEDIVFWRNYGNRAYARPDLAPPSEQLAAAQRGLARQGWGAWPACSRRLGLR